MATQDLSLWTILAVNEEREACGVTATNKLVVSHHGGPSVRSPTHQRTSFHADILSALVCRNFSLSTMTQLEFQGDPPPFGHSMLKYFAFDPNYVNLNHGSSKAAQLSRIYFTDNLQDPMGLCPCQSSQLVTN